MLVFIYLLTLMFSARADPDIKVYFCQTMFEQRKKEIIQFMQKALEIKSYKDLKNKVVMEKAEFLNIHILEQCYTKLSKLEPETLSNMFLSENQGDYEFVGNFIDTEKDTSYMDLKRDFTKDEIFIKENIEMLKNMDEEHHDVYLMNEFKKMQPKKSLMKTLETFKRLFVNAN